MQNELSASLPEFKRPPVVEVVCGILFKPLESLLAPHLGILWERFKPEYPRCEEVPPLAPVIERFDDAARVKMEIGEKPPLPRIWFIHESETGIIQVQRDRFLHNWRRVRSDDEYPRYTHVIEQFRQHLATFDSFIGDTGLGGIEPLQYELAYVNHIPQGEGFHSLVRIGELLPDFRWRNTDNRFLCAPEHITWRTSFLLPNKVGRLHVSIRNGVMTGDGRQLLLLELTARGMPKSSSRAEMWDWFDLAHEWIVRGFADLTAEHVQRDVWERGR